MISSEDEKRIDYVLAQLREEALKAVAKGGKWDSVIKVVEPENGLGTRSVDFDLLPRLFTMTIDYPMVPHD